MNGKVIIALLGALMLLILGCLYFVYGAIYKEPSLEKVEKQIANINSKNKNIDNVDSLSSQQKNFNKIRPNPYNNQITVDQKLQNKESIDLVTPINKNILGSEKEKINLEITLYDGAQNKLLTDFELEYKFTFDDKPEKYVKIKTDQNGKITISKTQSGYYYLQLKSVKYTNHSSGITLCYGKNEYIANLFIGGTIEIRATNTENKIVEGLRFNYDDDVESDELFKLDKKRGVYVISNMAIGSCHIVLIAPNYRETPEYIVRVDSNKIAFLEIRMETLRVVYIDLDIDTKPNSIELHEPQSGLILLYGKPPNVMRAIKNKSGLYEFSINNLDEQTFIVSLDQYVSENIYLYKDVDYYKVSMEKAFTGQIQIYNEKGKPVVGAIIKYASQTEPKSRVYFYEGFGGHHSTRDPFFNEPVSDEFGIVKLTGLKEKMEIEFSMTHPNYPVFKDQWAFDAYSNRVKSIVLNEGYNISGKISCGDKLVLGADVGLYQVDGSYPDSFSVSDADGQFNFNNLDKKDGGVYIIKAAHRNFGVAISSEVNAKELPSNIVLKLVPEKSLSILLVDNLGVPMPSKNISIHSNRCENFNSNIKTDENGKFELFNLFPTNYRVEFVDDRYFIKNSDIEVPASDKVLMAVPKYVKKILVKDHNGEIYQGELSINVTDNWWSRKIKKQRGVCFIEFYNEEDSVSGMILIGAQGYAYSYIGPYEKAKDMPATIEVQLIKGESIKITVKDELEDKPIPFAMVDISIFYKSIVSKSTNELGEVFFENLNDSVEVNIKKKGYAEYTGEIEKSASNEFSINLIKGSSIKGSFTLDKNVDNAMIVLRPYVKGNNNAPIDINGKFELKNILPGKYNIIVVQKLKNYQNKTISFQTEVVVNNEQNLEINLDEFVK